MNPCKSHLVSSFTIKSIYLGETLFSFELEIWVMGRFFWRDLTKLSTLTRFWHEIRETFKAKRFRAVAVWIFGAVKMSISTAKYISGGMKLQIETRKIFGAPANWWQVALWCFAGCLASLLPAKGEEKRVMVQSGLAQRWCAVGAQVSANVTLMSYTGVLLL